MANPNPDLYTIRIGAQPVKSPRTGKLLQGALTFEVVRKPIEGKGRESQVEDPHNLVVRPGDYVEFQIGDVELPCEEPRLKVEWKAVTGKEWPDAPLVPGKPAQMPPKAGYACQLFSYAASLDLGLDAKLPAQRVESDHTVITYDPGCGCDEC